MIGNVEHEIQVILLNLGIPTNLLGFLYLAYAMQLTLNGFEYITQVSKMLYVEVAEKYKTDPLSVERCIRHAIRTTFSHNLTDYAISLFGDNCKIPTNTQFISRMYFHLISQKEA